MSLLEPPDSDRTNSRGGNIGRFGLAAVVLLAAASLAWMLFVWLPGRSNTGNNRPVTAPPAAPSSGAAAPAVAGRVIKAHLFYVAEGGTKLASVEQDVPYGEGAVEQARAILTAQFLAPAAPLVSAIPQGTALKTLFITPNGEAYVDLSSEFRTAHPGGSLNEILTIYTIVNVLTSNLPAVMAVQVLVEGKEIDTLAGHVDLRRPLVKNMSWVE